jgi:hypothetical protein
MIYVYAIAFKISMVCTVGGKPRKFVAHQENTIERKGATNTFSEEAEKWVVWANDLLDKNGNKNCRDIKAEILSVERQEK